MRKGVKGVKYLLKGWSTMTPFTPFLIGTLLYEVSIEGMEYDFTSDTFSLCDLVHPFNTYFIQ
jgi:hypothetical protein